MESDKIIRELATLTEQGRWHTSDLNELKISMAKLIESHNLLKLKVLTGSSIIALVTTYVLHTVVFR